MGENARFSRGFFLKSAEKILKKREKTIANKNGVIYNDVVVCPRDEVISCRRARRVIIMDQPDNRAADLRRVGLCPTTAHPAACT